MIFTKERPGGGSLTPAGQAVTGVHSSQGQTEVDNNPYSPELAMRESSLSQSQPPASATSKKSLSTSDIEPSQRASLTKLEFLGLMSITNSVGLSIGFWLLVQGTHYGALFTLSCTIALGALFHHKSNKG